MARLTTSPASAKSRHKPRRRFSHSAFTLIELLVVIVIIGVLASILIPTLASSYRTAKRSRERADLAAIEQALQAYHDLFHDYPIVTHPIVVFAPAAPNVPGTTGADVLGWALIGPGGALQDGVDGPGFRAIAGGKIQQPLMPTESGLTVQQPGPTCILDKQYTRPADIAGAPANNPVMKAGNHPPILYYRGSPAKLSINQPVAGAPALNGPFVKDSTAGATFPAQFDYADNKNETDLTFEAFKKILGDTNANGVIDPGETAAWTGPYILWSAGTDGKFGLDASGKTDDVTNFDIPVDLRK